jgi:hypothetical protein
MKCELRPQLGVINETDGQRPMEQKVVVVVQVEDASWVARVNM